MANLKKRKSDQEEPNPLTDSKPPISYVRKDDDDSDSDSDSDVSKILEPLSREQLVALLRSAAASHPPTLAEIRRAADADPSRRKIFVHGLGWDTTADSLRVHFSPFGDIDDVRVVTDRATGKSKGYGFILFRQRKSARKALKQPQKLIDNRMSSCQLASLGPPTNTNPNPNPNPGHGHGPGHSHGHGHASSFGQHDNSARKIYVGNVSADMDGRRLLEFFRQFGEIEEGPIGFDRMTGKPKGFALFVYKTVDGLRRALEEPSKNFEGQVLVCNKASDGKGRAGPPPALSMGPVPHPAATANNLAHNPVPNANAVQNMVGGFGGMNYPGPMVMPDMAAAAAMLGQGFLGGMQQPNAAAMMAMLTAASQNPTAFNPAVLASLNPAAMMAAFGGAAGQQMVPTSVVQSAAAVPGQNYAGMGNAAVSAGGFNQNVGFQGPTGFQGPPGFQNAQDQVTGSGGAAGAGGGYQGGGQMGQGGPIARPPVGPMSGYGPH